MASTPTSDNTVLVNDGTGSKLLARQAANVTAADNAALAPLYSQVSGDVASGNFLNAFQTAESYNPTLMLSNAPTAKGAFSNKGAIPTVTTQQSAVDPITQMLESGSGLAQLDPSKTWTSADYDSYYKALTDPSVYNNALGANTQGGLWGNAAAASSDATKNYAATPDAAPNVGQYAGAKPSTSFGTKYTTPILEALIAAGATAGVGSGVGAALGGGLLGGVAGGAAGGVAGSLVSSGISGSQVTLGGLGKAAALGGVSGGIGSYASPATGALTSAGLPAPLAAGLVKGAVGAGVGALGGAVGGGNAGSSALTGGVGGFLGGAVGGATGSNLLGSAAGAVGGTALSHLLGNSSMATTPVSGAAVSNLGQITTASNPNGIQTLSGGGAVNPSTDTSLAQTIGSAVPGLLQGAAGVYGAQNAAQAQQTAENSAINTQQNTLGNINSIWGTQQATGQGANAALQSSLGLGGAPADPSNFLNMPGYQFAVQQGTQAIQRQAAAMGNAYTPNTAEAVGQYVTGTASQDYNTYINQLMGAAGLGTQANQGLQTGQQTTGNNISQLQQNIGQAQASGVQGAANSIGGMFGVNGAGTSLVNAAGKAITGGGVGSPNYTGMDPETFGGGGAVASQNTVGANPYVDNGGYTSGDYGFGVAPAASYTAPSWTDAGSDISYLGDGS